jgi:hypothetical protein
MKSLKLLWKTLLLHHKNGKKIKIISGMNLRQPNTSGLWEKNIFRGSNISFKRLEQNNFI